MINTAYSIDNKTPLYSALTAKKDYIPNVTKIIYKDTVGELHSSSKYKEHDEVSELIDTVNGEGEESFEYAKYWHGYLVFLRPLLLILDYGQIRIFLMIILSLLAILLVKEIAEKKNTTIAILYLLSLVCVEYFYVGLSLINSVTFLVMMISSLVLAKRFDKIKNYGIFFFVVGMMCSFFCLLDTPLLTIMGPLIIYYIYKKEKYEEDFKDLIKFGLLWLLGYSLTWATKWVLVDAFYHRGLFATAIGQVLYRSIGKDFGAMFSISINLLYMAIPIMLILFIILYLIVKYREKINKETRRRGRIFFIISLVPIIWYAILKNHSSHHSFFTYRLLFITMLSIMLGIFYICGEPEK